MPSAAVTVPVEQTAFNLTQNNFCEEWEDAQHVLFQSANLCFVAAFMVPHRFRLSVLVMRVLLTVGFLMVTLWAGADICAPDIFGWNLTFLLANCIYSCYLAYHHIPPRIHPELVDLYTKVFLPLKMDKKNFRDLVREAEIRGLEVDDHYAMEGMTAADERLAILLTGRMKATCENVLLHYVQPNEFIDSPEWESCPIDSDKLFQVTLTALEPSRYLRWSRRRLQNVLKNNRFLDVVLHNLIGKDITHKLYSLNEFHRLEVNRQNPLTEASEWWKSQIPRSLSVDAVHTGTKGHVRSLLWRNQDRRGSGAPSNDSLGTGSSNITVTIPLLPLHHQHRSPVRLLQAPY